MRVRVVFVLMSCLVSAILFLVSCGQPAQTGTTTPPVTTASSQPTTTVPTLPKPASDKPQYGGTLTVSQTSDITGFDEAYTAHNTIATIKLTNEELLTGDWTKGPAGTGQFQFISSGANRIDSKAGCLAESWESPGVGHLVFHFRHGVDFALDPNSEASRIANGRELNAEDIVWNLNRLITTPTNYIRAGYPDMCRTVQITAPDKWTVDITCPTEYFADALTMLPDWSSIFPPEVIQKYTNVRDWRNNVGSGPFMMTDYVSGSSVTFIKNSKYWGTDPVGPGKGNQLPYLDAVKMLIIPDASTTQAAFRTGKIAGLPGLVADDYRTFIKASPELQSQRGPSLASSNIYMRTDKSTLAFKDKRVRQALTLATDFNTLKNQLYGGEAEILGWPIYKYQDYLTAYTPLDQCSAAVQDLYKYNPDKAKQMLADAGYPNGFKTSVLTSNTATYIDLLSSVAAMWAKVGVTLTIDAREPVVFNNVFQQRAYTDCILTISGGIGSYFKLNNMEGTGQYNASFVDDPYLRQVKAQIYDAFNQLDWVKVDKLYSDLVKNYVLEQCWVIGTTLPYTYDAWWPWLHNYHGEQNLGYGNTFKWCQFAWLDRALKEQMTGSK
jgi:peptide/nickel transport system substrate-binding protein